MRFLQTFPVGGQVCSGNQPMFHIRTHCGGGQCRNNDLSDRLVHDAGREGHLRRLTTTSRDRAQQPFVGERRDQCAHGACGQAGGRLQAVEIRACCCGIKQREQNQLLARRVAAVPHPLPPALLRELGQQPVQGLAGDTERKNAIRRNYFQAI